MLDWASSLLKCASFTCTDPTRLFFWGNKQDYAKHRKEECTIGNLKTTRGIVAKSKVWQYSLLPLSVPLCHVSDVPSSFYKKVKTHLPCFAFEKCSLLAMGHVLPTTFLPIFAYLKIPLSPPWCNGHLVGLLRIKLLSSPFPCTQ